MGRKAFMLWAFFAGAIMDVYLELGSFDLGS